MMFGHLKYFAFARCIISDSVLLSCDHVAMIVIMIFTPSQSHCHMLANHYQSNKWGFSGFMPGLDEVHIHEQLRFAACMRRALNPLPAARDQTGSRNQNSSSWQDQQQQKQINQRTKDIAKLFCSCCRPFEHQHFEIVVPAILILASLQFMDFFEFEQHKSGALKRTLAS
eukprot:4440165-Amphidinium_carterae.1